MVEEIYKRVEEESNTQEVEERDKLVVVEIYK